jgi:hypothetical protein
MLRDDDETDDPGYPYKHCHRTFSTYAALEDHSHEHEGLKHCGNCGATIRGFHKCR